MNNMIKKAYAKLNFGLQVIGKREDDYHNLKMIMTTINLYDELIFTPCDKIEVICCPEVCKMENNLVYKTILLMKEKYNINKGIKIEINKKIPIEAGLAGGSSDAACTIKALNEIWDLNKNLDELQLIAQQIGSDVPYCLVGGWAQVSGKGEIIESIKTNINFSYIIIKPKYSCKTKDIFNDFKIKEEDDRFNILLNAIKNNDRKKTATSLFNDLRSKVDDIISNNTPLEIINMLIKAGCIGASMTGSGSCVFGVCLNNNILNNVYNNIKVKKLSFIEDIYLVEQR